MKYDELDEVTEEGEEIPKTHSLVKRLPECPCEMSKRYTLAALSSIGFLISFGIRCNMGVAIIQMTSNKTFSRAPQPLLMTGNKTTGALSVRILNFNSSFFLKFYFHLTGLYIIKFVIYTCLA